MKHHLFPWLPPQGSTYAPHYDILLFTVIAVTGVVTLAVLAIMAYFALRYRKGSSAPRAPRSSAEHLRRARREIEITWITVPLLIFLAIGVAGAWFYFEHYAPPANAMSIYVVGKQWLWKIEHANGKRELDQLHVPLGIPVRLVMTSQDVIHSFFVPGFRIKQDVLPGRYTELWFEASRVGEYHLFCAEYCGTEHSHMIGRVVVMKPTEFADWLEQGAPRATMAQRGAALFRSYGCSGCHGENSTVHAPPLQGVFGSPVPLSDGSVVVADERYVRDSILQPKREIAAGYEPIMPSFAGRIDEEDLLSLIAYIRSIAAQPRSAR